jgi:hypothetical protein
MDEYPYLYTGAGLYEGTYPVEEVPERGTTQNPIPLPVRGPIPAGPVPSNLGIKSPLFIFSKSSPSETVISSCAPIVSARFIAIHLSFLFFSKTENGFLL